MSAVAARFTPVRARATAQIAAIPKLAPTIASSVASLPKIAQHLFSLMLRNVASDGFAFTDPTNSAQFSAPGCVIAAPSFPLNTTGIDQDYVYNWTRDAAIAAMEIAAVNMPAAPGTGALPLIEYVTFAQQCQNATQPGHFARASFTIEGQPRDWTDQDDGPALQSLAIMMAYSQLDAPTQTIAQSIVTRNINYLMGAYQNSTFNLWEEHSGASFFARASQLRFFQAIQTNTLGVAVPLGIGAAITWLQNALQQHWDGTRYVSVMPAPALYDPNIDIVCACIYGAVPCTDTKLLATAAQLRSQWADDGSPSQYPINVADRARGIGPLLGRYPGDTYDGDLGDHVEGDHPWALCTSNFAELYYRLANTISSTNAVPYDQLSAPFFNQIGVTQTTAVNDAVTALNNAGDAMLNAVVFHSDHLELSEQFDGNTGYEKSVKNLTWSYAAFLSAVRAKTGQNVQG